MGGSVSYQQTVASRCIVLGSCVKKGGL